MRPASGTAGKRVSGTATTHRRVVSTRSRLTRRPADPPTLHMPQMPSHAHHASAEPEEHAEYDDQHHVLGAEEDEAGKGTAAVVAEQQVASVAENERQQAAEQPFERPFEEEWAADEPVGGAHQ